MSKSQNQELENQLAEWLTERDLTINDIMSDDEGTYYVITGQDDEGRDSREVLPNQFQEMAL